jgi:hypothetical protein
VWAGGNSQGKLRRSGCPGFPPGFLARENKDMFDICLTGELVPESGGQAVYGRIQIEDYFETFVASLVCWAPEDYGRHWTEGCRRLFNGNSESSLISSYVDPSMSEFLMWWPLYREGEIVHVRNEILPYATLEEPFAIEDPWSSIRLRRLATDEGFEVSEWETSVQSLREFLSRRTA